MTVAEEINRLHAEAEKLRTESRDTLHVALVAAWNAGQLLIVEKRNVRRTMGPGAWLLWLERYFAGTPRTAQRYMQLAATVADVSLLYGMSLRRVYFRLRIATEPKSPARSVVLRPVPRHVSLTMRLLAVLPVCSGSRKCSVPTSRISGPCTSACALCLNSPSCALLRGWRAVRRNG